MKAKELISLTDDELLAKEKALKEDLYKLNIQRFSGRVDKPHEFARVRKDIARIETILSQRKGKNNG
ncbi:MAG: 50S ribosomal protein L29 [Candidatus Omnitrophica bacterium]|nr:50S ribosomal protein L29 [Candidatus Omnitrophota bacterium]